MASGNVLFSVSVKPDQKKKRKVQKYVGDASELVEGKTRPIRYIGNYIYTTVSIYMYIYIYISIPVQLL